MFISSLTGNVVVSLLGTVLFRPLDAAPLFDDDQSPRGASWGRSFS